jgi:hypothetical protein
MLRAMWRAALPAITAIAYLWIAVTPCPPSAELRPVVSHEHTRASADETSITAPCPCSCDHGAATQGVAKRGEPAALIAPAPPTFALAHGFAGERAQHLPDAPISVDSPVPIAA